MVSENILIKSEQLSSNQLSLFADEEEKEINIPHPCVVGDLMVTKWE